MTSGNFAVKRAKSGCYNLTLNAATADGMFALSFPTFTVDTVEAVRPENGQPPRAVFKASAAMLDLGDD